MSPILALALGIPAWVVGIGLVLYANVLSFNMYQYVADKGVAPDLIASRMPINWKVSGVISAYVQATGDRRTVRKMYAAGFIGMVVFFSAAAVIMENVRLPGDRPI
jgi:hypothetical protein